MCAYATHFSLFTTHTPLARTFAHPRKGLDPHSPDSLIRGRASGTRVIHPQSYPEPSVYLSHHGSADSLHSAAPTSASPIAVKQLRRTNHGPSHLYGVSSWTSAPARASAASRRSTGAHGLRSSTPGSVSTVGGVNNSRQRRAAGEARVEAARAAVATSSAKAGLDAVLHRRSAILSPGRRPHPLNEASGRTSIVHTSAAGRRKHHSSAPYLPRFSHQGSTTARDGGHTLAPTGRVGAAFGATSPARISGLSPTRRSHFSDLPRARATASLRSTLAATPSLGGSAGVAWAARGTTGHGSSSALRLTHLK